jgi:hypothetical protein
VSIDPRIRAAGDRIGRGCALDTLPPTAQEAGERAQARHASRSYGRSAAHCNDMTHGVDSSLPSPKPAFCGAPCAGPVKDVSVSPTLAHGQRCPPGSG